jgi:Family of unknown function (DUF6193)
VNPEQSRVEAKWQQMLADFARPSPRVGTSSFRALLLPALRAAAEEPVLRALYPFTSAFALAFSRTTDYPFDHDAPAIWCWPTEDRIYTVTRSWGVGPDSAEPLFKTRDPAEAARKVVDLMETV